MFLKSIYALAFIVVAGVVAEGGFLVVSLFMMGELPFSDDFAAGFSQWNVFMRQNCCAHSADIVDAPLQGGKTAARFELHFDDRPIKGSKRSEFRLAASRFGVDYEYCFRIFLASDWAPDSPATVLMQMHNVPDLWKGEFGLTPPIAIQIEGGAWVIRAAHGRTPNWFDPRGDIRDEVVWRAPADFGNWSAWRMRVRWSLAEDGYVAIEKDGAVIVDLKGPNAYDNLLAPYMKFGVYVPAWKTAPAPPRVQIRSAIFTDIEARVAGGGPATYEAPTGD